MPFWSLLSAHLESKHHARPVHSYDEISELIGRFPDKIECHYALQNDVVVAGAITFKVNRTLHLQYSAANEEGSRTSALTLLLENLVSTAVDQRYRYFSFGVSTEQEGRILNDGLYNFKNGFGAGGIVHEFYSVAL
jgi:hypothetical protein